MRNDSFSLKFYLGSDTKHLSREWPVYLRIVVNRKKVELSTKLTIKNENDWDEITQRVKYKGPVNSELNKIEAQITNYYYELKHNNKPISALTLKELYLGRGESTVSLKFFLQTSIKDRILENSELSSNTTKNYVTTLIHLNSFLEETKQKNISLLDINEKFLRKWDTYLVNKALFNKFNVTLHRNTINKYHSKLRVILNMAIDENIINRNPYSKFKLKYLASTRTFLTAPELQKIETSDLGGNVSLDRVRDKFLFSVYTGLRFKDADDLKNENIEFDGKKYWVVIVQNKTKEYLRIPLLNKAKEVYDKYEEERKITGYVLPRMSNQKINSFLKVIAKHAGITKPLTHHVSRHTAATTIFLSNGVPLEIVSKQLGHTSIKTTQIYAKITNEMLSKAADKLDEILK